ncbi:hypothetical protein RRG08_047731 [Elysia crispata]|uniref:Uncharacterized protein n=1 Tax=Elysia crispata TaxID=231223 RepID=A0AAE1A9S6_9GAST|nr:hypothetical protein RRG08_047731 [Elysia crispata]
MTSRNSPPSVFWQNHKNPRRCYLLGLCSNQPELLKSFENDRSVQQLWRSLASDCPFRVPEADKNSAVFSCPKFPTQSKTKKFLERALCLSHFLTY